jgi:type IV pilus assembly protein PilM
MFSFFSSKKIIGLDIGASAIKMVQLDVGKGSATLNGFGFIPTPPQSIVGGEIADPVALSSSIKSLVTELKSNRKSVAVGLWGSGVIVKKISIPRVDENVLADQIKWEAEQYIPFDIKEISLEHYVLKTSASAEMMDILLVAAKKPLVFRLMDIISGCDLTCDIVDLSTFALANCYTYNYGISSDIVALLDIGSQITNFAIIQDGQVMFCRDVPVGGFTFTADISREMGVSLEEAEGLKLAAFSNQQVPSEVSNVIKNTTESVAEEIQNSFNFFSATGATGAISKFLVTGGSSGMTGFADYLTQVTGAPNEVFDPFIKVKYSTRKFSREYIDQIRPYSAVGIGLALRAKGDS